MYISVTPLLLPHLPLWASICHFHMALHPLLTSPWLRPIHHSRECTHLLSAQAGAGESGTEMRMGLGITEFRQIAWLPPRTILSQNRASFACWILDFGFLFFFLFPARGDLNDRFQNVRMEMEMMRLLLGRSFPTTALSLNGEGERDHNASCPGGGDTGMQSSRRTEETRRHTTEQTHALISHNNNNNNNTDHSSDISECGHKQVHFSLMLGTFLYWMFPMIHCYRKWTRTTRNIATEPKESGKDSSSLSYSRKINTVLKTRCWLNSWCLSMLV